MTRAIVVEDNVDLAENVAELLESIDCVTTIARDGPSAVEAAIRGGFDLAIVDVRLPNGVSGLDLLPALKAHSDDAEFILVTGNATVDSAVAAVRHGAFAYVQKPFASRDLLAIVERALEQVRLRRERRALAERLERSEAVYRSVVENVDALIVMIDVQHRITFCNQAATSTMGRTTSECLGRSFLDLVSSNESAQRITARLDSVIGGRAVRDVELTHPRLDAGTLRTVRWAFTPLATGPGERMVLATGIDVSERLELERRNAESQALAAIGTLTTGLAHEIRNPLNAASLQLEALLRSARKVADAELEAKIETRVHVVRAELGRLTSMLNDFLGLARPIRLDSRPIDLGVLLADVAALKAPLAEAQNVTLDVDVDEGAKIVAGDVAKIRQVVVNLVVNALDALRERGQGTITLRVRARDDAFAEIAILDDGPGLSRDITSESLFQPFVTTKEAGTGLGLAIVQSIVTRHGGTVRIENRPTGGAAATFTLPRVVARG